MANKPGKDVVMVATVHRTQAGISRFRTSAGLRLLVMENRTELLLEYDASYVVSRTIFNCYYFCIADYRPVKIFVSSSATASPTWLVLASPPMSVVLMPLSIVRRTASSTNLASSGRFREYWRSIEVERIAAMGLTTPFPEMSGADPINQLVIHICLPFHYVYRE